MTYLKPAGQSASPSDTTSFNRKTCEEHNDSGPKEASYWLIKSEGNSLLQEGVDINITIDDIQ